MARKKKEPIPDRDWKSEYAHYLRDELDDKIAGLTDWRIDMYQLLDTVLAITGDVKTQHGRVHRTPKGDITVKNRTWPHPYMLDDLDPRDIADIASDVADALIEMVTKPKEDR